MTIQELAQALNEAEQTFQAADTAASRIARLLKGRMRRIESNSLLSAIKRELKDYNIQTGRWKE